MDACTFARLAQVLKLLVVLMSAMHVFACIFWRVKNEASFRCPPRAHAFLYPCFRFDKAFYRSTYTTISRSLSRSLALALYLSLARSLACSLPLLQSFCPSLPIPSPYIPSLPCCVPLPFYVSPSLSKCPPLSATRAPPLRAVWNRHLSECLLPTPPQANDTDAVVHFV